MNVLKPQKFNVEELKSEELYNECGDENFEYCKFENAEYSNIEEILVLLKECRFLSNEFACFCLDL